MSLYIRYIGSKGRSTYVNQDDNSKVIDNLKDTPDFLLLKSSFESGVNTFIEYSGSDKKALELTEKSKNDYKEQRAARYAEKSHAEQFELIYDMLKDTYPDSELIKWQKQIKLDISKGT